MPSQITSQRTKSVDRVTIANFCFVMGFLLSIFFNKDMKQIVGYSGTDISDGLRFLVDLIPILIGLGYIIFLLLIVSVSSFLGRPIQISIRTFTFFALVIVFIAGVIFNNRVLIARELIEFRLHEKEFQQLVALSQPIRDAPHNRVNHVQLPPLISEPLGHHMMVITSGSGFCIGLVQDVNERETDFYYIDGTLPTSGSAAEICGDYIECYYQIDDHWFLCNEYSNDI